MQAGWQRVLPVLVSIFIIIIVAILRNFSPRIAAVTATMPINIPLALWIVYSDAGENRPEIMVQFAQGLLLGIVPTVAFLIVCLFLLRAEWSLVPVIATGYIVWGTFLGASFLVQQFMHA